MDITNEIDNFLHETKQLSTNSNIYIHIYKYTNIYIYIYIYTCDTIKWNTKKLKSFGFHPTK